VAELLAASRSYRTAAGPVTAVDRLDLAVRAGEIVGVVGPSGAGKSTLLRLLAGIEAPDSGELRFAGEPAWTGRARVARYPRPGYVMPVFQDPYASLDPRWPIWRSITEPLTARQPKPDTELRAIAAHWMTQARLDDVDPTARPAQLSGGQCQRAAILRAMIAEPALLVADEPVARQDVLTAAAIADLFTAAAARGTAVVIASHDKAWLARITARIVPVLAASTSARNTQLPG
jgi:peptide/nickel transport system ATP-binding protein